MERGRVLAVQSGVHVAKQKLEDGIVGIVSDERLEQLGGVRVTLVEVAKIAGEIVARFDGGQLRGGRGRFKLADAFLLVTSRNAHEEAEDLGKGGERVSEIVVQADAGERIAHLGVEREGTQEMFASFEARAGDGEMIATKAVQARLEAVAHAREQVHGGGFLAGKLSFGELDGAVGEGEVGVVLLQVSSRPRVNQVVANFAGVAVSGPPAGFDFKQVADGMAGHALLEAASDGEGGVRVGVEDLIEGVVGLLQNDGWEAKVALRGSRGIRRRKERADGLSRSFEIADRGNPDGRGEEQERQQ